MTACTPANQCGRCSFCTSDGLLLPPPSNPMAVARDLLPQWLADGIPTLRSWRGAWMRWARTHWAEMDDAEIRAVLYRRLEHATFTTVSASGDVQVKPWAPTKRKIADLLDALGALTLLPSTIHAPAWIDAEDQGQIVACANGLLRVADRKLLDHTPAFFNLVSVPFDYDPAAPEPSKWLEFLGQLWPDDPDSIAALQEFFGYVVSGRTDLHKIFLILGPTRSGKGTIARVLTALIGKGNMAGPTLASLASQFGLSPLIGKPLAIVSDARLGSGAGHQVVERLLTISGEDTIDVDRKFKEPWTGRLPTRFLILSNELPNFGDASGAIAHRFIVLTMQYSWLGKENTSLTEELTAELPGILNWALDGLARLAERGRFTEPASSVDAVIAMKDAASPMSAFVRECCEVGPGREVLVDELYQAWRTWCEDNGRDKPGSKQTFGRNLQAVVPRVRRSRPRGEDGRQIPTYLGIKLASENRNGEGRDSTRLTPGSESLSRVESRHNPLQLSHETCCKGGPLKPQCQLCALSPTYHRKDGS